MNVMVTERLGKAGGKISFLRLINLSDPSFKTKESNISECWRLGKVNDTCIATNYFKWWRTYHQEVKISYLDLFANLLQRGDVGLVG